MCMLIVRVSSTGHEQLLRFFSSCQHHASGEAGRCAWIHARNSLRSSGPSRRRARGNARGRSARSRHARTGCTCAPRPGLLALSSGTTRRGGSSTYATTRRRSDFGARSRHPTQVRTGGACLIWQLVYRFHPCLVAKRLSAESRSGDGKSQSSVAVAATAGSGASSDRMSMRHPVILAASRAF